MKNIFYWLFTLLLLPLSALSPERVIVLYNESSPESVSLAKYYVEQRSIPSENLIALKCPPNRSISQEAYDEHILAPLTKELSARQLWKLDSEGVIRSKKFDVIVTTYGIPYQIEASMIPASTDANGAPVEPKKRKLNGTDAASLDSELALIGQRSASRLSLQKNPFYKSYFSYEQAPFPDMTLIGRIDGPSLELCKRMIDDAIAVEQTGLYGKCYIDLAQRTGGYTQGEEWLQGIIDQSNTIGIPTIVDPYKDVFVNNYPLQDAALYFGWYKTHASGSFENSRLKQGSIAVHLHSFSARQLRNRKKNWVGPILNAGAAATLGNVYEPFLSYTTHLDLFYKKLTSGATLVESAWYATPALSWMNVVIGDPLYRPFLNQKPASTLDQEYAYIRSLRPLSSPQSAEKILNKAQSENSPLFYELAGLLNKDSPECLPLYQTSFKLAKSQNGALANALHEVYYHRDHSDKETTLALIRKYKALFGDSPQSLPFVSLNNILDPPPPPPVEPISEK